MIRKKFELIGQNKPSLTKTYMRQLFKRHPDLFLKSYASIEAKVWYLKKNLNIQVQKEKSFPMLLHFNYNQVLQPRCEAIKQTRITREFDLVEVLKGSDEEFCNKFGVEQKTLDAMKKRRKDTPEVDELWVYTYTR